MKYTIITGFFFIHFMGLWAQTTIGDSDALYREDQFYFGLTYNTFSDTPNSFSQSGFSPGIKLGFIRDFPINSKRTIAIALGLGYAFNTYSENIKITKLADVFQYEIVNANSFKKNRFSHHGIEIPLEFRWRTSSPQEYKFWRIYAGFKASYVFASNYLFENSAGRTRLDHLNLNPWQYGLTLSLGYNNWNGYLYYGLNPMFRDAYVDQDELELKSVKIGLMFYFL